MSQTEKADIVERLRASIPGLRELAGQSRIMRNLGPALADLNTEAAAEIERLQSVEEDNKQAGEIIIELKREVERLRAELQARRAADAGMREALNVATNAIQWMSAASDFAPEGKAHEGWKSIRRDMEKIAAALGARDD